jgi:hypothetical protein
MAVGNAAGRHGRDRGDLQAAHGGDVRQLSDARKPIARRAASTHAGPGDQGWYVYDIWESPEHFQRFAQEKLGPAIEAAGAGGGAQPEPQFFPIQTLAKGPSL